MAQAFIPKEIGGDHFRSTATFLTQAHVKQTEGSDVYVGTSFDQIFAHRFGQETPIPSMQLSIENSNQAGGCAYGYTCVYTDTLSGAAPTEPLPVIRDPRGAFEQLFGAGATPEERTDRRLANRSILDWVVGHCEPRLGPMGDGVRDRDIPQEGKRRAPSVGYLYPQGEEVRDGDGRRSDVQGRSSCRAPAG